MTIYRTLWNLFRPSFKQLYLSTTHTEIKTHFHRRATANILGFAICTAGCTVGFNVSAAQNEFSGNKFSSNTIGPNPQELPSVECTAGKYETEHIVEKDRKGRYKMSDVTGSHRFDATNTYFDGYDSSGDFVHWPISLKVPKQSEIDSFNFEFNADNFEVNKQGYLSESDGHRTTHNYSISVPNGLSEARFYTQFSITDPGKQLYMKLTDPDGEGTFYNSKYDNFESAVVENPKAGIWTVRAATKKESGIDVNYTLDITGTARKSTQTTGCWYGGVISGAWDENASDVSWEDPYHHSGGITIEMDNFLIEDATVLSHGDGIRPGGNGTIIDGAYVADIHDDCIENDNLGNILVTDSFLDGCYVGFSARDYTDDIDGSDNLFEVKNSLVRLEAQPTVYKPEKYGEAPGHGQFFKWTGDANRAMKLSLHNTIFLASQAGRHGGIRGDNGEYYNLGLEEISTLESCSNNVMVWTGVSGEFPNQKALEATGCFTVVEDYSVWVAAEAAWRERHPGRPAHP